MRSIDDIAKLRLRVDTSGIEAAIALLEQLEAKLDVVTKKAHDLMRLDAATAPDAARPKDTTRP